MAGINKVIIVGNLGRDPEIRYTQSGTPVCTLSIATTRKWTNRNTNQQQEETEWHRVSVWGKQGESCNTYLTSGRLVYVEGRLRTSKYKKNGVDTYSTEIVSESVQFLGSANRGNGGGRDDQRGGGQRGGDPRGNQGGQYPENYDPGPNGVDDDIPF